MFFAKQIKLKINKIVLRFKRTKFPKTVILPLIKCWKLICSFAFFPVLLLSFFFPTITCWSSPRPPATVAPTPHWCAATTSSRSLSLSPHARTCRWSKVCELRFADLKFHTPKREEEEQGDARGFLQSHQSVLMATSPKVPATSNDAKNRECAWFLQRIRALQWDGLI